LPNKAAGIAKSRLRIAGYRRGVFETSDDPALQQFAGPAGRAIRLLTEGATDGKQIVAGHDDR
jgi:hypothetical protein